MQKQNNYLYYEKTMYLYLISVSKLYLSLGGNPTMHYEEFSAKKNASKWVDKYTKL